LVPFEIPEVYSYEDFYLSKDVCFMIDYDANICYVRRNPDVTVEYEYFHVDAYDEHGHGGGITLYDLTIHHIWNVFDEFGLLLGLPRLFKESNNDYRIRLRRVFSKRGGPTKEGLENSVGFLLGIDGVEINELCDVAFRNSLLNPDGSASDTLKKYARIVNDQISNTWDHMSWDRAYWKALKDSDLGFEYLPHVWDASISGWDSNDFQSGIGSGLDLFVKAPLRQEDIQDFDYYIGGRAIVNSDGIRYPDHYFDYRVVARGKVIDVGSLIEHIKYTIVSAENFDLGQTFENATIKVNGTCKYQQFPIIEWDTGTMDNSLERVSSNKIMSPSEMGTDPVLQMNFIKITVTLENNVNDTPILSSLTVGWKDTSDVEHSITLDDQTDFEMNDNVEVISASPLVHTARYNVTTDTGCVELAHGEFQQVIDTDADWRNGTLNNLKVIDGAIRINIPDPIWI
jgi:hypothetical protein